MYIFYTEKLGCPILAPVFTLDISLEGLIKSKENGVKKVWEVIEMLTTEPLDH